MTVRLAATLILILPAPFLAAHSVLAAEGDLDLDFGIDGIAHTGGFGGLDSGVGTAIQADGKILLAGYDNAGGFVRTSWRASMRRAPSTRTSAPVGSRIPESPAAWSPESVLRSSPMARSYSGAMTA
jgi:hypothetical protein